MDVTPVKSVIWYIIGDRGGEGGARILTIVKVDKFPSMVINKEVMWDAGLARFTTLALSLSHNFVHIFTYGNCPGLS